VHVGTRSTATLRMVSYHKRSPKSHSRRAAHAQAKRKLT
jgi:hypothetical protein